MVARKATEKLFSAALAACLVAAGTGCNGPGARLGPPGFRNVRLAVTETSLGRIPRGMVTACEGSPMAESVTISPDAMRAAYVVERDGKHHLVVNGTVGPAYDEIAQVRENGIEGDERMPTGQFAVFSPDSRRVAYKARRGGKWMLVVDGVETRGYGDILWERSGRRDIDVFSPNSRHFVMSVTRPGERFPVPIYDGNETTTLDEKAWAPVERESRKGTSRRIERDGKYRMVVNGVEGKPYGWVGHGSYIAGGHGSYFQAVLSRDGRRYAYAARRGNKKDGAWLVVVDGTESPEYTAVGEIVFSPNGRHLAYAGELGSTGRRTSSKHRSRWFIVLDGVKGKVHRGVMGLHFSPDGRRLVYRTSGRSEPALIETGGRVVCNGVAGKRYDRIAVMTHSPDGRYLAYYAERGGCPLVVVETAECAQYRELLAAPRFTGPGALRFVALCDGEILRVDARVVENGCAGGT